MREMRRSDRMITDREEIVDVLDSCKVFRMAIFCVLAFPEDTCLPFASALGENIPVVIYP